MQYLAEDILGCQPGDRIATTAEYQNLVGVGSGTVQKALTVLESVGAVRLSRHGHLGTKIVELNHGGLWSLTGRGEVRIVATLPGAIDAFGLSKGMYSQFAKLGIPIDLRYLRGASPRAKRVLRSEADIAVMSRGAAESLAPRVRKSTRMVELGQGSYYAPDSLVRLARAGAGEKGPLRVAIDRSSYDHLRLTEAEFPPGVDQWTYVDCAYTHLPGALIEDKVDVGVWHRTLLPASAKALGLTERSLTRSETTALLEQVSPAVLVVRSEDTALWNLLQNIDVRAIVRAQRSLLAMDPSSPSIHDSVWSR